VALVYVDGMVVEGEGSDGVLGGSLASDGAIRKAMRMALRDPSIKAVVIRIDSPGGSALASEAAWQAIRRVARVKPVVVSVGNMAASGGYYIACAGERIFADPSAIVGSIGVVGGKLALGGLYQKLGITTETFSRGANAGIFSSAEPFTADQRLMMKNMMKQTYDQFVDRILTTRKGRIAEIDKVARGRVFVGEKAVELGLVDEIGGIEKAISYAADRGALGKEYEVRILPGPKTLADIISGGAETRTLISPMMRSGFTPELMALPQTVRKLAVYQLLAARELEHRPVLLLPSTMIQIR
jgi:protease IV